MGENHIIRDVVNGKSDLNFERFRLIMGENMKSLLIVVRTASKSVGR